MGFLAQAFVIVFASGLINSDVYAQRPNRKADLRRIENERQIRETQMVFDAMMNNKRASANSIAPRASVLKMSNADKKRLEPTNDLTAKHEAFLKTPKTRLIRLLPGTGCNLSEQILAADEKCRSNTIPGGGAFYSFRREKHVFPIYADLQLKENNFTIAGLMTQGILVSLGTTKFEKIDLTSEGMEPLVNFIPSNLLDEANKQAEHFHYGQRKGKYNYARTLPIDENAIYALRLIAYRPGKNSAGRTPTVNGTYAPHPLDLDKRADIIVVYRVAQKDADGSLWLLWRELANKKSPVLNTSNSKKNQK